MASFTAESFIISRTLSRIGYSSRIRRLKQNAFDFFTTEMNKYTQNDNSYLLCSGSKSEGLTSLNENDIDLMFVFTDILCLEYPERNSNRDHKTIFQLNKRCSAPGYAVLELVTTCDGVYTPLFIKDFLVEIVPGEVYLSSDFWKHHIKQVFRNVCSEQNNCGFQDFSDENHGPATVCYAFRTSCDHVSAFTCECPSYLYHWVTRERKHQWPSAELIRDVSQLESHVVPVGTKDGPLQFLEWRICYSKGEIRLIRSLNDCLAKVLVLMKAIAKGTLHPLCKEVSSYIMKNIILWIAELYPQECFSETNLITVLQFSFQFLKQCLLAEDLPSYMIPERNLFADRLTIKQKTMLCMRIDCLLRQGPSIVLTAKNLDLRTALSMLHRTPNEFASLHERRNINECACLLLIAYTLGNIAEPAAEIETMVRNIFTDNIFLRFFQWMQEHFPEIAEAIGDDFLKYGQDDIIEIMKLRCRR
ncbi:uncharacterized protein LOC123523696 [Mercenaria mercenaria]|uniref:uncharacterized protein LOC123523696 n=1 Tax=Mercenaria mercenaria TaxID=6596 RepID=UPI00234E4842|nr:uncharacterized protein LOC123523696 [Mercenaria mercenaria]